MPIHITQTAASLSNLCLIICKSECISSFKNYM